MESLPKLVADNKGTLIYNGRNKVWIFNHDDIKYVVKKFHSLGFWKGIIYTFFRENKARRAFENGQRLLKNGIKTPEPIALIEEKKYGLYNELYYVTGYIDWLPIRKPLIEDDLFNLQMTLDYAHFLADLHQKGIIHKDLNNTNVLYHLDG